MLIVRSPLRISLAGGGTDLPDYYCNHGGAVINTSIDRYFYIFLRTFSNNGLEIASADFKTFFRHEEESPLAMDGDLHLPKAIFHHFAITKGVSLFLASEIPPGTGLGSSGSVAVGLVKALSMACGLTWSRAEIAELAAFIEIEKLGSPIGKQDQYAASFGGLNVIEFRNHKTRVEPLKISLDHQERLQQSLMLFYTGQKRNANEILSQQKEASKTKEGQTLEALHRVREMVPAVQKCLECGDIESFGRLLHENWQQKKRFAQGVSNPRIDEYYEAAVRAGAWGGKITGAGGGGFLMLCCDEAVQARVSQKMEHLGLIRVGFHFESLGARVIMNSGLRLTSKVGWKEAHTLLSRTD